MPKISLKAIPLSALVLSTSRVWPCLQRGTTQIESQKAGLVPLNEVQPSSVLTSESHTFNATRLSSASPTTKSQVPDPRRRGLANGILSKKQTFGARVSPVRPRSRTKPPYPHGFIPQRETTQAESPMVLRMDPGGCRSRWEDHRVDLLQSPE